ncbi:aminotransferase class V-fold PLP-dependent enzyme [Alcaligenes sp. WGS1538]|uniref:aminotransferase class V-fold PLP-dependent enzyme n=1 Tax=Alcaligenes sp. WGS1538 TaxID=3366811 RepID=UPI00372D1BFD
MSGYFLYHSIGMFEGKQARMQAELAEFSQVWSALDDSQWGYALGRKQAFIEGWAQLIGGRAQDIALSENVTGGLYSILGALPSHVLRGRILLVAGDCFPSLHFLLQKLAQRLGFTLRTVPLSQGLSYVTDDDFIRAWDDSVGLALVTWVSSTSSHRVDVDRMAQCAREHGSLMALDLTQAAGLVPFQLHEGVAFTLSASLKWVCGVSGASLLHVRPDLIEQCEPEFRGWFSQDNPFNWNLDQFSYAPDARRFDHGTPSVLGSIASLPGMRFVLETGVQNLWEQNQALTALILERAARQGWPVLTPLPVQERGGSVMLRASSAARAKALVDALCEQELYCDHRDAVLRLSPGNVCEEADVLRLCDTLQAGW